MLKYTKAQEDELTTIYGAVHGASDEAFDARDSCITWFMHKHGKTKRSVISKLSKLQIYVARPKTSKVIDGKPTTKKEMCRSFALKVGMNIEELEGLDKCPKLTIQNLLRRFS